MMESFDRRTLLRTGVCGLVVAAVPLLSRPAAANPFDLKVEYAADLTLGAGERTTESRLWRTPTAYRQELVHGGERRTVVLRLDRNVAWIILRSQRMVVETDLDSLDIAFVQLATGRGVKLNALGTETIRGYRTTKYQVEAGSGDGGRFNGLVWSTAEGIVLRVDGVGEYGGRRSLVKVEAKNIQVGKQDPKLFESPPGGYVRMALRGPAVRNFLQGLQ